MYKKIINKHLSDKFLNEEAKHNGLATAEKVQKAEKKVNKAAYKEIEKKMKDYDGSLTQEDKDAIDEPKTNIEGDTKDYHDEMEIRNGQEMLKYDNEPSERFKERAEMALAGDSKMGNKTYTGDENGNTEEVWGSSGGKNTGEEIVKAVKASTKKRNDAEYNLVQLGDDIENSGTNKTKGKTRKVAVENKGNNNKPLNETKMKKRLRFKKPFDGLGNALQLIPETYRVDSKEFEMTDGNETYDIRWEGSLTEGKAVVLKAADSNMVNEDIQKMKHLMGYKAQDTLGTLKGEDRITENKDNSFRTMLDRTRSLMTESTEEVTEAEEAIEESDEIEGQSAPKGDWDDAAPKGDNHADHIMEEDETIEESEEVTEGEEIEESEEVTEGEEIDESLEEGKWGKMLGTDKKGLFTDKLEKLSNSGYQVHPKAHASAEEMYQKAEQDGFKGKLRHFPKLKAYMYTPYDELNLGSATGQGTVGGTAG